MNCANHTDIVAAAFCRTCGKPLCNACARNVGGVIYCEACLAERAKSAPAGASYSQTVMEQGMGLPPNSAHAKPALAGFLGLIPGVGAMYNGQFMKGLIHLGIFVVIVAVTDKIGPIMIPVYFAYFFYSIFDAYKTAQALEQGLPLPDPFGLERAFGSNVNQTSWHRPPVQPVAGTPGVPWDPAQQQTYVEQEAAACASNVHGVPIGAVILIGLGCLLLLHTLDLFTFDFGRLWPIILIVVGAWMFFNRWTRRVS